MDHERLRAAFPLLARTAYFNAGTCGPVPQAAVHAAAEAERFAALEGRGGAGYFDRLVAMRDRLRAAYAGVLGTPPEDVALTSGASEGMARVLVGLELRAGDEIVTADDEHPGLYGPLAAARDRLGVRLKVVPLADVADAVGPQTRLVACSHVSWASGATAPAALAEVDVPVLFDGAQGAGAVPVDLEALGCDFYAAAGQKWLCGPIGTGLLWVSPAWHDRLVNPGPLYLNLATPDDPLHSPPQPDARRHDTPALALEALAPALAAHDVLAAEGWEDLYDRAARLAEHLADALRDRGCDVAARDRTTLVAWSAGEDPAAEKERLAAAGIVLRDIPGTGRLRASVGAWNDEDDLARLLAAL